MSIETEPVQNGGEDQDRTVASLNEEADHANTRHRQDDEEQRLLRSTSDAPPRSPRPRRYMLTMQTVAHLGDRTFPPNGRSNEQPLLSELGRRQLL